MEHKPRLTSNKVMYLKGKKIEITCWVHNPKATKDETQAYIKDCQDGAKQNKVSVSYYLNEFMINDQNKV